MGSDIYETELQSKLDRKVLVGNFMESQEQARLSRFGGDMLARVENASTVDAALSKDANSMDHLFAEHIKANMLKLIAPIFITTMTASVTYPLAVRIVRGWPFRVRGYYAIHFSIAPFLALINVNVFGVSHGYFRIKLVEADFRSVEREIVKDYDYRGYYGLKK